MVKQGSKSFSANKLADTGLVMAEMARKMMKMEKEIGRLRHHVSVLSKREVGLKKELEWERKGKEEEEVASGEAEEEVAESSGLEGSVAGLSGLEEEEVLWDERVTDLRSCISDEDVLVGGKIIPMKGYEPGVEVVEVGSSTVVPKAPRAIQGMIEREVVLGAPAGPRAREARGRGMGPFRRRGQTGFGPSGSLCGTTGGFYARGSRGGGRG